MTTVGVTGHINISGATRALVAAEVAGLLAAVEAPLEGWTSLAPGADQLFAWAVTAAGGSLTFVSPSDDIETTIPEGNRTAFLAALKLCETTVSMPFDHASEDAYFTAGAYIADNVDLLVAVWDGAPPGGRGGTADIVQRRRDSGRPLKVIWPAGSERI